MNRRAAWEGTCAKAITAMAVGALALVAAVALGSCMMLTTDGLRPDGAGGGMGEECQSPADCPGLALGCRWPTCDNGLCDTGLAGAGVVCSEDDGRLCNGLGDCVECVETTDCAGTDICQSYLCVAASCGDGELNGDETDLDCGGSCGPCANADRCLEAGDCQSRYCSAAGACAPCSLSEDCLAADYCDTGSCTERRPYGDLCDTPEQCQSGFCPSGGACCDAPCDGACMSCIGGHTGLLTGRCSPVELGDDPWEECVDEGTASCGANGTGCNGAGACILYSMDTVCGPAGCQGGNQQGEDYCDGQGQCVAGAITVCSPYICSGTSCLTSCDGDDSCLDGAFCQNPPAGSCVSQGSQGDPCGGHNECVTNFCADGRCCESACSSACMACASVLTEYPEGSCRSVLTGIGQPECSDGACYRIDPTTGECRLNAGRPCPGGDSDCLSGLCIDGTCA